MATVAHPRVRPGLLEDRVYQEQIAEVAVARNTLVVLPTGLGKTAIALRVIAEFLLRHPTESILFLAPTRPLVVQHAREVARTLLAPEPLTLTGAIAPERRAALLKPPQVVVATPQVIGNDLSANEFPLDTFSLIVFDEAHRAVGDYPYVAIATGEPGRPRRASARDDGLARRESAPDPRGMGESRDRAVRIPYRAEPRRRPVHSWHWSGDGRGAGAPRGSTPRDPPAGRGATAGRRALRKLDLLPPGEAGRRVLLEVGNRLQRQIGAEQAQSGSASGLLWKARTAQAAAMKGLHALELVETQGVDSLREFLGRQRPGEGRRWTRPSGRSSATRTSRR